MLVTQEETINYKQMNALAHKIYLYTLASIVVLVTIWLSYQGWSYYATDLTERFYHDTHDLMKPSGVLGHGYGIVGTLLVLIGVFSYIARKRYRFLHKYGRLKHWLEFHIFLCTLGPILILFHTAFKFGGIVSISFWSMVLVVASGVIGRFIYIQIPRTIEGRELSLNEVQELKSNLEQLLLQAYGLPDELYYEILAALEAPSYQSGSGLLGGIIQKHLADRRALRKVARMLKKAGISKGDIKKIKVALSSEMTLDNRIARLQTMQKLFRYWHVAHLPFAIIMLIIMVIHVGVTLAFGYRWIF